MDKFLLGTGNKSTTSPAPAAKLEKSEKSKRSHLPVNITVKERAPESPYKSKVCCSYKCIMNIYFSSLYIKEVNQL